MLPDDDEFFRDDHDAVIDGLPDVIFWLGITVVILYGGGWLVGLST